MFHFSLNKKIQNILEKIYDLAIEEEILQPLITKFLENNENNKEKAIAEMSKHLSNSSRNLTFLSFTAQYFSLTLAMERFGHPILKEIKFIAAILFLKGYTLSDPDIKNFVLVIINQRQKMKTLLDFINRNS